MKNKYLKEWAEDIQKRIWEREVFMEIKKSKDPQDKDLDVLKMNNEKDQEIVNYINENYK
jgi:hypothetical protein